MIAEPWLLDACPQGILLDDDWLWGRVRDSDGKVTEELSSRGLRLLPPDRRARPNFVLAARHLSSVPSLQAILGAHVQEITLLDAAPGYDVSHSEPRWPKAIFVSSPAVREPASALRLLENVVHEGMHLQLTCLERKHALVAPGAPRLFSPWKLQERDVQGVLHGVYVFACIYRLFRQPAFLNRLDGAELGYVQRRRGEIATELTEVDWNTLAGGLKPDGVDLLKRLLASIRDARPPSTARARTAAAGIEKRPKAG